MIDNIDDTSLVVCTCDKYEDAWYPYFELLKKYWRNHPKKIYLVTETKQYHDKDLEIINCNSSLKTTWSERLYLALNSIKTDYIFFSLEDFFIKKDVDEQIINECINWMKADRNIAVCRLYPSNLKNLKKSGKYKDFYYADSSVKYRLETQFAIWNRKTLIEFLDIKENPWEFESKGSKRVINTDKTFLWYYQPDCNSKKTIISYGHECEDGTGIHQGQWLWENKTLFEENNIKGINFNRLGTKSERIYLFRKKYLYSNNKNNKHSIVCSIWIKYVKLINLISNIRIFGIKEGINYYLINK